MKQDAQIMTTTPTRMLTIQRVRVLSDRVLVRRAKAAEREGSIIIPESAQKEQTMGDVVAVGPGARERGSYTPLDVRAGDRVIFGRYAGTEVIVDGETLVVLREDDILMVFDGGEIAMS